MKAQNTTDTTLTVPTFAAAIQLIEKAGHDLGFTRFIPIITGLLAQIQEMRAAMYDYRTELQPEAEETAEHKAAILDEMRAAYTAQTDDEQLWHIRELFNLCTLATEFIEAFKNNE